MTFEQLLCQLIPWAAGGFAIGFALRMIFGFVREEMEWRRWRRNHENRRKDFDRRIMLFLKEQIEKKELSHDSRREL